jgi:hypothetical protein
LNQAFSLERGHQRGVAIQEKDLNPSYPRDLRGTRAFDESLGFKAGYGSLTCNLSSTRNTRGRY